MINLSISFFSAIVALTAAILAFKANKTSNTLKNFQKNSILIQREVQLLMRILELLKIYDVWCKDNGAGADANFHESKELNYNTRDEAWAQIPRDIKYLIIQLSSHSQEIELLLEDWENDFIEKISDSYMIKEEKIKEKIKSLRNIVFSEIKK